jgi:hypothetical protein
VLGERLAASEFGLAARQRGRVRPASGDDRTAGRSRHSRDGEGNDACYGAEGLGGVAAVPTGCPAIARRAASSSSACSHGFVT